MHLGRIGQLLTRKKDFKGFIKDYFNKEKLDEGKIDRNLKNLFFSKYLIVDTNLFLYENNSLDVQNHPDHIKDHLVVKYQITIYILFELSRIFRKELIIIDDVLQELFIKTIQPDENLKKMAEQSLNLLSRLKKKTNGIIKNENQFIKKNVRKSVVSKERNDSKYEIWKSEKRLVSIENDDETAEEIKTKTKNENYGLLHADDTIKGLIYYKLKLGELKNILVINDDNGCKYQISRILDNQLGTYTNSFDYHRQNDKLQSGYSRKDTNDTFDFQCSYTTNEIIAKKIYSELVVKFLNLKID